MRVRRHGLALLRVQRARGAGSEWSGEMKNKVPEWALKEDGSLGNTMVPKLGMEQEVLARLASERYDRILELERRNLELCGEVAFLRAALEKKE